MNNYTRIRKISIILSLPVFMLTITSCLTYNIEYDEVIRVHAGEAFETQRGGTIQLLAVYEQKILLSRTNKWPISEWENVKYHIGNKEYLQILKKNVEKQYIDIRLSRRGKAYAFDF